MPASYVRCFEELGRKDVSLAGGKGANLGEMLRAGLPVPPGFVVTTEAFRGFYQASGLAAAVEARLAGLDVDDPAALQATAETLQGLVVAASVPEAVRLEVGAAYRELGNSGGALVAVRSSATVEDSPRFSFAGMFRSFLNVRGEDELIERLKTCWASVFGARVLFYRVKQGLMGEHLIAVVVQKMVDATRSGVLFTVDPASRNPRVLVIEGAWGLGEVVVGGEITPDRYVVDKADLHLIERAVGRKDFMLTRDAATGANARVELPEDKATASVLSDAEVRALADLGRRLEAHYGIAQDAEWALEDGTIFLVQTRPVTTLAAPPTAPPAETRPVAEVLVRGLGASPGLATGVARVLRSPREGARLQPGEILVTGMTAPDWVPLMRRAAAIVTDGGGMTSHAAIVSRELGIPCIVGTRRGSQAIQDGMEISVDATEGVVYRGAVARAAAPAVAPAPVAAAGFQAPITATRLYVNLAEPDLAEQVARQPVDGVGLLRAEFMLLSALEGKHPRLLLEQGQGDEFVARMADTLRVITRAFAPRPVIYRSMDFKTNEFRGLEGGERFEPAEPNPMLGYRGCYRNMREPDLFALELRALQRVREELPSLHLMIPFVRTGWEFRACKRVIDEVGLSQERDFQLWIMAEVPSVVYWLPEYAAAGVRGVSIGSNDLTQLVLGVDRDSEVVAPLFDERDAAVLATIQAIIAESHRLGLTVSICGQAPSVHADFAETLVRWGIDSISVNPDVIEVTRRHIAAAEQRVLLEATRQKIGVLAPRRAATHADNGQGSAI
jgi:pyruvate,water dikinase